MKHLISKGRKQKPINMILHGVHGIGKTTFATESPNPIFVTGEEIEEIESAKFPKCESWDDYIKYLTYIRDETHDFKTLVIDTLDSIESLLWKKILQDDNSEDMARAMGGFGKGYTYATQRMTEMRDSFLVPIRDKKDMNIILLCHSTKNKFEDPLTQTSYDVYEMKLHKNGKGYGAYTVFAEWVSIIAFANFEVFTVTGKKDGKDYAIGEGERRMFLTPKPAYDAKNRFNLPDEMPLSFEGLKKLVDNFFKSNTNPELESLKIELIQMVEKIEDEQLRDQTINNIKSVSNDIERLKSAKKYIQGVING